MRNGVCCNVGSTVFALFLPSSVFTVYMASARRRMPKGTTTSLVKQALMNSLTASRLEDGRKGKTTFEWKLRGRKCDKDALFENRQVLEEVLRMTMSLNIDKAILNESIRVVDKSAGGAISNAPADIQTQAYSLKQMLMGLSQVCRNVTTGARLSPWLASLVRTAKVCPD